MVREISNLTEGFWQPCRYFLFVGNTIFVSSDELFNCTRYDTPANCSLIMFTYRSRQATRHDRCWVRRGYNTKRNSKLVGERLISRTQKVSSTVSINQSVTNTAVFFSSSSKKAFNAIEQHRVRLDNAVIDFSAYDRDVVEDALEVLQDQMQLYKKFVLYQAK